MLAQPAKKNDLVDLFSQKTFGQIFDEQINNHVFKKDLLTHMQKF
jgi:hypothetical protein